MAIERLTPWSRRALLGLPILVGVAGCVDTHPYKKEDDAIEDALSREPMWVTYRPTWVESESGIPGRRPDGPIIPGSNMRNQSDRFLHGVVPPDAAETARAAAVQYGWSVPDDSHYQQRLVQGNGLTVSLHMFITRLTPSWASRSWAELPRTAGLVGLCA